MLPAELNTNHEGVSPYKKSFAETLCEGFHFELKDEIKSSGTRSVFYYSQENSLLVSHVFSNRVHILNLATGKLRWFDHHGTTVRSILVCNNEILTASWDGTVCVTCFDSLKPRLILTEKEMGRCPYVTFSPESDFMYSYSYDSDKNPDRISNTVRKWHMADGKLNKIFQLPGVHLSYRRCGSCEIYNNRLFVVSDTGHLHIYNTNTGILLAEDFYNDHLQSLCLVPASNILAMGGSQGNIYLSDLSGERILQKRKCHSHDVTQLIVHPDKPEIMISISFDGTMNIWKLPDLELLGSVNVNRENLWTASVVNDLLLTGGEDGDIWIYDIKNISDIKLKGNLIISKESYALLPSDSNSFFSDEPSMIQISRNDNGEPIKGQFAEYLLNTACNFKIFKELFCPENKNLSGVRIHSSGFFQIT